MAIRSEESARDGGAVISAAGLTKRHGHVLALDGRGAVDVGGAGALLLVGAAAAAIGLVLFSRRDLRSG